jgi:Fe-S-cluster containining protein
VPSADPVARTLDSLRALHDEIDDAAEEIARIHGERIRCRRGCSACCIDDLTVMRVEAERIRGAHPDLLDHGTPHAVGGCAFLDGEGACRIYADRPQVCRSQGLPLRILFENEADEIEERRDICPLNVEGGPPIDALAEDACWLIGPYEWRIQQLDDSMNEAEGSVPGDRVALRDLFRRAATRAS